MGGGYFLSIFLSANSQILDGGAPEKRFRPAPSGQLLEQPYFRVCTHLCLYPRMALIQVPVSKQGSGDKTIKT